VYDPATQACSTPNEPPPECVPPTVYDPATQTCTIPNEPLPDENLGSCPGTEPPGTAPPIGCGNPINSATGNKFQTESDYAGSDLLQFARYYNSAAGAPTHLLGSHWTNTYTRRITFDASTPTVAKMWQRDGHGTTFNLVSGVWRATAHPEATLLRLDGPSGELLGWTYQARDGSQIEDYDALGRLIGISRTDGQAVVLVYNNGVVENNANDYLLTSVTAQDGRRLAFSYDASLRISQFTDPAGATYSYGYDASGRLQSVTYPGGSGKTYLYNEAVYTNAADLPTALTGIVDEKGQRYATFTYAADGRAISTEHAGGVEKFAMTFNADGTTAVTSPTGAVETRGFAAPTGINRVAATSVTVEGVTRTASYTYDSNGFVDITTEPFGPTTPVGVTTDYDFNARGLLTQKIESANQAATRRKIQTDWHATFNVPTERRLLNAADALEAKTTWTYNTRGQVLTATQVHLTNAALSRTATMSYCEQVDVTAGTCPRVGLVTAVNGPRTDVSDVTTYTYYPADDATCASAPTTCPHRAGDLWKVTNALGQVTETLRYDGAGRPLAVKDANGVVTDLEYSTRGWLTARKVRGSNDSTEADDAITRLDYDLTGAVSKVTQPDGAFVSFIYDDAHRLTDINDALGNTTHYVLNNAGARLQENTKDAGGALKRTLSRVFDGLGQLRTLADAFATPTDFTYDFNGALNKVTDPLGRITDNDVDSLGRLIQTVANIAGSASDRAVSLFQYDARDNLTKVIDPKGLSTTYGYDSLGNLASLLSPDTGTTTYSYDLAGNRISQLDARGKTTGYTYDALNRLTVQTVPTLAQKVYFDYDVPQADCQAGETFGAGRLARIRDESGSTRYCYDARGRRVRQVQYVNQGTTLTLGTTFNAADRVVAMTYPSGAIVSYLRNANGQITRVDAQPTAGAAQVTLVSAVSYLPFGPLASLTYGNGRVLTKAYDQNYGIDSVADSSATGLSQDVSLDAIGNLTALTERTGVSSSVSRTYTYDGLDRLTAQKNGTSTVEGFAYDATGNRTSQTVSGTPTTYTYAAGNHRLSSVGSTARTYDGNGNTTLIGTASTGKAFTFNDRNRLREVRVATILKATNLYNGRGERVGKKTAPLANSRQYVYDEAGHLLGEYTAAGARVKEYVWLDDTLVAVLSSFDASTYQYVETDHLGTPRAVVHPSKNSIAWRWDLNTKAFGEHLPNGNPDGDSLTYELNLRFPGQYYDAESGLYYNYFRDYDPAIGRYIESDPVGMLGGISTFGYARQNPFQHVDEQGLMATGGPGPSSLPPFHQGPISRSDLGATDRICIDIRCFDKRFPDTCSPTDGWRRQHFVPTSPNVGEVNAMEGCACVTWIWLQDMQIGAQRADIGDVAEVLERQRALREFRLKMTRR
jgi:RHS repeat-associated protein